LHYTHYYEGGFREFGAGGVNLRIADGHVNSLGGEVGLRLSGSLERNTARLGAGLSFLGQRGLSASFQYDGEFSQSERGHGVFGFLRFEY